eukprot:3841347-Lingulodinium_polyedra.AAC.1
MPPQPAHYAAAEPLAKALRESRRGNPTDVSQGKGGGGGVLGGFRGRALPGPFAPPQLSCPISQPLIH